MIEGQNPSYTLSCTVTSIFLKSKKKKKEDYVETNSSVNKLICLTCLVYSMKLI